MELQWYVAYTHPGCEKKVAETLAKRKIENFCPLNNIIQPWKNKKRVSHEILFNSYVFVLISEEYLQEIRSVDGIISIVYWLDKPVIIPEDEIIAIKDFIFEYKNIRLVKITIESKDKEQHEKFLYVVKENPHSDNTAVSVVLQTLGYKMVAEMKQRGTERAFSTYVSGSKAESIRV